MQKSSKFGHGIWYVSIFVILGLYGALLRAWELVQHYNRVTSLFEVFETAPLVPFYVFACGLAALVCAWLFRGKAGEFMDVYGLKKKTSVWLRMLCGVGFIGAGTLKCVAWYFAAERALAAAAEKQTPVFMHLRIAQLVFGILTILTGVAYMVLTRGRTKDKLDDYEQLCSNIPVYWACYLLILTFMEHPVEPVLRTFAYDLLAACALAVSIYKFTARCYGKLFRSVAVFTSLFGITLIEVSALGRVFAWLLTGNFVWVSEVAFRIVAFALSGVMILLEIIPLLYAPEYVGPPQEDVKPEGVEAENEIETD